jgi:hypothetical protein
MWAVIPRRTQLLIVAALAMTIVWSTQAIQEWRGGTEPNFLQKISLIASALGAGGVFVGLCWRWLWHRLPILGRKIFPDLNGEWHGHGVSSWKDDKGQPVRFEIVAQIRMSWFSTSVTMRTGESTSHSLRCDLDPTPDAQRFRLWYWYENQPRAELADRSARHRGAAWLDVDLGQDANKLTGQYFTERQTGGDLSLTRVLLPRTRKPRGQP